ncbi:MAG: hypothetical protein KIY12_06875 [Thermoplasmata archaeon]|uniref:Uncharacterized protein n=1 Tax=Candidatus Sysuiplasma superficiale TaxID=2823368 RepID=A0A8J8CDK1_9ARCH|nr:hypothetical protein [Candidatus Sysuiplasma superficiale]
MKPKYLLPLVNVLFKPEEREEVRVRLTAGPIPYWKSKKGKEYMKKYTKLPKYREYQRKYQREHRRKKGRSK